MTNAAAAMVFLSVLFPAKGWFGADQALTVNVKPPQGVTAKLVLTDFSGASLDARPTAKREFGADGSVDVREIFPALGTAGTYLLYAVPADATAVGQFYGTPLVINVREDTRRGAPAGPMVVKIVPLRYAIVSTDAGDMTVGFYYDVAPNTVANFQRLAEEGFYDGLTFHRVEPDFLVQAGDPRGDGTGGPGYSVGAEFSDRKHEEGVLSMSRNVDPNESPNNPPRPEYANSAGSQFFVALDRKNAAQLDGVYTVFGRVVGAQGLEALAAIAGTPVADKKLGKPTKPPVIKRIEVRAVTAKENPYLVIQAPTRREGEQGKDDATTPTTPTPPPVVDPAK
jgi:peptidyl-prolyl cis-trans isomerase B (cyclophilin B)